MARTTLTVDQNVLARFLQQKGHYQSMMAETVDTNRFLNHLLDLYQSMQKAAAGAE